MSPSNKRNAVAAGLVLLSGCLFYSSATPPQLTQAASWGATPPAIWPTSTQVMMTPTVMNLRSQGAYSQIAFISFSSGAEANADANGVLRVIDNSGTEIARFPDPHHPIATVPSTCSTNYPNLAKAPHLSPLSGLALAKLFPDAPNQPPQPAFIVGVLDNHTDEKGGLIAFRLIGNLLIPQWCSQTLSPGDFIPKLSPPVIAQLDASGNFPLIAVDNKVYDGSGHLRFSGGAGNPLHGRMPVVANLSGTTLPQVITGNTIYTSAPGPTWTNPTATVLSAFNANDTVFTAVADLDLDTYPEIVVVDTYASQLYVFTNTGAFISALNLKGSAFQCGGPPMIGSIGGGVAGVQIGVATCTRYGVYKYSNWTLGNVWDKPIVDHSGQTTSTLFKDPAGTARIFYGDEKTIWVFDAQTGQIVQQIPTSSQTGMEGPIIASFDSARTTSNDFGRLIVAASNYTIAPAGQHGIRIFTGSFIGRSRAVWNQHTYHQTNVATAFGDMPATEPNSWGGSVNSYRVQQ